jgi:hypothetical protein
MDDYTATRSPAARRQAQHRAGVVRRLDEIQRQLTELRRDLDARIGGHIEVSAERQRDQKQ